jgi:hypothetical protein
MPSHPLQKTAISIRVFGRECLLALMREKSMRKELTSFTGC